MLVVSDNGSGMTDSVKKNLFEPFYTTKELGRGTGLGLAMVYGAISQNGGRIEVYSELGHGTTFKIYLPRVHEVPTTRRNESPSLPLRGTETILLVEDEAGVRDLATRLLASLGYTVLAYPNGSDAIKAITHSSQNLHLLITDVIMPGMNGLELSERIRKIRPSIKVLFNSGYTDNVIVHLGILKEGVEFLPKPYSIEVLARRVREVLEAE